ncbi:tripartite tricarboxylate transporter TctB family protein [Roseateles paludis]|uniref:Tripartite tricarboxylate transporter TctB family protein n=1 Tax=Roseateles paludis TaxID=3145238 RepID=A0ABV0FXJ7_9BURK
MSIDRHLARGLVLAGIALAFGLGALRFPLGTMAHAGPGLFPLMVSVMLLLVAVVMLVRSRFTRPEPLDGGLRNVGLIMASLCAFALASHFVNMTAGIVALVFVSSFAGGHYSTSRNLKVSAGLIVVALAFQKLLGLNLPLY